jgi:hypothetical protein
MDVCKCNEREQLTLGQLIDKLERMPKMYKIERLEETKEEPIVVHYDFAWLQPTTLHSFRGYYEQLGLGHEDSQGKPKVTVSSLLAELRLAIGKVFEDYKGGSYRMSADSPVWVENYGDGSNTAIVGVHLDGWCVVLETMGGYQR